MEHNLCKFLTSLLVASLAILAPLYATMATVGFLVFMDLLSGVWAAYKRNESITSAGLRRTVSKTIIYLGATICGFLVERYMTGASVPVTKIVAGFIGLTELKSILENSNAILGVDLFKALIQKLGSDNDSPPSQP